MNTGNFSEVFSKMISRKMNEKLYELENYRTIMSKRIIEANKQDHTIHGYMVYQCEVCGNIYVMWLEKGLEDPTDDEKTGMHKPVPFGFTCPACSGVAIHVLWSLGKDSLGKNYKSYQKYVEQSNRLIYRNFFWNDPTKDCGIPIIFEPDYYWNKIRRCLFYITEIYINTLPDDAYEGFSNAMNNLGRVGLIDEEPIMSLNPAEIFLEEKANREQKRHGPFGRDGYKRPRSNKKLYEY